MADAGGSNLRNARAYLGLAVRKEGRPAAEVGSESYVAWGCELRWQERGRKREKEVACSLIKLERFGGGSSPKSPTTNFRFLHAFFFLFPSCVLLTPPSKKKKIFFFLSSFLLQPLSPHFFMFLDSVSGGCSFSFFFFKECPWTMRYCVLEICRVGDEQVDR